MIMTFTKCKFDGLSNAKGVGKESPQSLRKLEGYYSCDLSDSFVLEYNPDFKWLHSSQHEQVQNRVTPRNTPQIFMSCVSQWLAQGSLVNQESRRS